MADHNDPNAVNSIFSDIDVSAADLYDLFGFPSDDSAGGEKVVIALTFASVPQPVSSTPTCFTGSRSLPTPRVGRPARKTTTWKVADSISRPSRTSTSAR